MADPTEQRPAVKTPRRYCLLKAQRLLVWDPTEHADLAAVFFGKQFDACADRLPDIFPERARLAAARYVTVEDLDGADADELHARAGLHPRTAEAVLTALDALLALRSIMGYTRSSAPYAGQYANTLPAPVLGSTTAGASANGAGIELGDRGTACLTLTVSAASGVLPTLDVAIQTSSDNGATDAWRTIASFAQKTAAGSERKSFAGCDRFVRPAYTIGGTAPSFTFSVDGEAK